MELDKNCLYRPVIFYKRNGELLSVENIHYHSITKFFLLTAIHKNCVTLMHLRPCLACYPTCSLEPTYYFTTIEKSVLCSYQLFEEYYPCHCYHTIASFNDCIYNPFTILSGYDEMVLWKSNFADIQYGTLQVWVQEYTSTPIEIIIHQKNGKMIRSLNSGCIKLDQCVKVTIKTNGKEKVKGVFKINMESIVKI